MSKKFLVLTTCLWLSACALPPRTVTELKSTIEENPSLGGIEHFEIHSGGVAEVSARLREFAERCLSVEAIASHCGLNGCSGRKYMTFTPKFEKHSGGLRFALFVLHRDGIKLREETKDGSYVMVAEVDSKGGKLKGHVWAPKYGYGDLLGTTKGWMTGTQKACPDLI